MKSYIDFRDTLDKHCRSIFKAAVTSVEPRNLLRRCVRVDGDEFVVNEERFTMRKPCYVVGFGKAVLGMALVLEEILGDHLGEGIVMIPAGITKQFAFSARDSRIRFIEGAKDNLPDEAAHAGAEAIKNLCDGLREDDLLIVLISGGGSALLPLPPEGVELAEKLQLIKDLAKSGADILELNCVRKRISRLKGGGLAESAHPAKVVSLILSDVIDDPLDFIASGPTVRNLDGPDAALKIVDKYKLTRKTPLNILKILGREKRNVDDYGHVKNFIIGSNTLACTMAREHAQQLGYETVVLSTKVHGEVTGVAEIYSQLIVDIINAITNGAKLTTFNNKWGNLSLDLNKPVCLIAGGEPTVVIKGNGKGGRNQHLVLQLAENVGDYNFSCDVHFLSCGTDGIDGPTDAAGALGSGVLKMDAISKDLVPDVFLRNNDAYTFFERYRNGQNFVKIGHTGTNVMDIHVIIIQRKTGKTLDE